MKMEDTKAVCWNITNVCNANCHFCHRMMDVNELTVKENLIVLEKLIQGGIDEITWSGGECLMYNGIEHLIKYAFESGIKNKMITNGKALTVDRIKCIVPFLKSITFSLDSADDNVNATLGRGRTQYGGVYRAIVYIKENYPGVEVKVNTVVNAVNKEEVQFLPGILAALEIDRWKVFKFMDVRGSAKENRNIYSITDEEFDAICCSLRNIAGNERNYKIQFVDASTYEDDYIMVDSSGRMYITNKGTDHFVGSLLYNNTSVLFSKISVIRGLYCA